MKNISGWVHALLGLVLLAVIALRFAEPIQDGDLFWQMAYGRYMLQHWTLIPDHTLFSWTPTGKDTIYCAWIAEVVLYGLYSVGGYAALFALRYLVILGCLLLVGDFVRRARQPMGVELYLYVLVATLAGYVGSIIKPELFSLLFFYLLAWGFFRMKLESRSGQSAARWRFFFPGLILVWVNTHGVWTFGMVALVALCAGEWLNRWMSPRLALPAADRLSFTLSVALSALACLINPYGIRYPWQLLNEFFGLASGTQSAGDSAAYQTLAAHQTIFKVPDFHFVEMMAFMILVLAGYFVLMLRRGGRGARVDWAVASVNLLLGGVTLWYVRTTYYWPPFFLFSCIYLAMLLRQNNGVQETPAYVRRVGWGRRLALAGYLVIALLAGYQAAFLPYANSFCGFGVAYWNPVYEAEYVARFCPQPVIYNDYDNGGYLLWRLYPQTRIFIDSRSFPFRSWYREYNLYENGRLFQELLDRLPPANVAVISIKNLYLVESFMHSEDWKMAFMGPSACVFIRSNMQVPPAADQFAPDRFEAIRNLDRGIEDFEFALRYGKLDEAFAVVKALAKNLGYTPHQRDLIQAMTQFKGALEAERAGDLDKAIRLQEDCLRGGILTDRDRLMQLYAKQLQQFEEANKNGAKTEQIKDLAIRMQAVHAGQIPPLPTVSPEPPPAAPKTPAASTPMPKAPPTP